VLLCTSYDLAHDISGACLGFLEVLRVGILCFGCPLIVHFNNLIKELIMDEEDGFELIGPKTPTSLNFQRN
jgi:hypothetical protein